MLQGEIDAEEHESDDCRHADETERSRPHAARFGWRGVLEIYLFHVGYYSLW